MCVGGVSEWVGACVRACMSCLFMCAYTCTLEWVCLCMSCLFMCAYKCTLSVLERVPTVVAGQCALSALPVCRNVLNWEGV